MFDSQLIALLVGLAIGAGIVALGGYFYPILKKNVQGYPGEAAIETALLPIIYQAICAGFKLSESAVVDIGQLMDSVNKAEIANMVYDMLPDSVGGIPVKIIKTLISRTRFAELVQSAYDDFHTLYESNLEAFKKALAQWEYDNK